MKKSKIKIVLSSIICILFISVLSAQKHRVVGSGTMIEKTRNVGSFKEVGVSGSFDVFLVKGKEGKIDIKIEDNLLEYLITEVENGKLKIKWKKGVNIRTMKTTVVTVNFNEISSIGLSGSGDVVGKDVIKSNDVRVALAGSGDIDLKLEAKTVDAAISGSGDIDLRGTTTSFEAAIAGSGDIEAFDLKSDKAEVRISGSGDVTLSVKNDLKARISGSGDIRYKGNPKYEDTKVSGSGSIRSSN